MDSLPIFILSLLTAIVAAASIGLQFWLRRIAFELQKRNELDLRFKKMEMEAAQNRRRHE